MPSGPWWLTGSGSAGEELQAEQAQRLQGEENAAAMVAAVRSEAEIAARGSGFWGLGHVRRS